ncbi:MAG: RpiB/LacA/LacB family sugar-phosphate isomerase [Minisyncoccota bacterium]
MRVYFASDHAGFELKNKLIEFVRDTLGADVQDCGAHELDTSDDYPRIIASAAKRLSSDVSQGIDSRAVLLGGSGQGEAMVANRFKGVRAALYYGEAKAPQTDVAGKRLDMIASVREHNDANALSLGARFLSLEEAQDAVRRWLETSFSGDERHARRVADIDSQL